MLRCKSFNNNYHRFLSLGFLIILVRFSPMLILLTARSGEVTQVPVMEGEVEDEQWDEEEACVIVQGRPRGPLHREEDPAAVSARGEDEVEDGGRDEGRYEYDQEEESTTAFAPPRRTARSP
jgi:hypothetical protein